MFLLIFFSFPQEIPTLLSSSSFFFKFLLRAPTYLIFLDHCFSPCGSHYILSSVNFSSWHPSFSLVERKIKYTPFNQPTYAPVSLCPNCSSVIAWVLFAVNRLVIVFDKMMQCLFSSAKQKCIKIWVLCTAITWDKEGFSSLVLLVTIRLN